MFQDIKNHLKNCITCSKIKKFEKHEKAPTKTILSHGARDRYIVYVLDIIDHFPKFTQSYLLNSKEIYEIFPIIKNFFKSYGYLNI